MILAFSLSLMPLMSIQVVESINGSFLFYCWVLLHCMEVLQSGYPFTHWWIHLAFSQFLVITYKPAHSVFQGLVKIGSNTISSVVGKPCISPQGQWRHKVWLSTWNFYHLQDSIDLLICFSYFWYTSFLHFMLPYSVLQYLYSSKY